MLAELDSMAAAIGHNIIFNAKKYAPEIMMVTGTIGVIATVVSACKGTMKFEEVMEEHRRQIEGLHAVEDKVKNGEISPEKYSEEDGKKDRMGIYIRTTIGVLKAYAPTIILGAASIGCFLMGANIINKRYLGVAAALNTLTLDREKFEERVKAEIGEEKFNELKFPMKETEVISPVEDPLTGLKVNDVSTIKEFDSKGTLPPWARIFDSTSGCYDKDPEANRIFLWNLEQALNNKIRWRAQMSPTGVGYLLLNEVWPKLDFDKTQMGATNGWLYYRDQERAKKEGVHNYVSLGVFNADGSYNYINRHFINGTEPVCVIVPNIDGDVISRSGLISA
jgi:hypothetical protein